MRHWLSGVIIALLVFALLPSTGVSSPRIPIVSVSPFCLPVGTSQVCGRQQNQYEGVSLFQGLFFGRGPATKILPEIAERFDRVVYTPEDLQLIDRLIRRIGGQNPSFFATFGADLRSGDRLRIELALDRGARILVPALREELGGALPPPIPSRDSLELDGGGISDGGGTVSAGGGGVEGGDAAYLFAAGAGVLFVAAAAVVLLAAVYAVAWVDVIAWSENDAWNDGSTRDRNALRREVLIDLLARRLAPER